MNLKIVCIQNCMYLYFEEIIKLEDFDFNIVIDEKSHENFNSCKTFVN